jgi:hypothetical protein
MHSKKYSRGTSVKAWDAPEAPLLHRQKSGYLSTHYIFIASCTMHFSWRVFTLVFSFVCCNKWLDPNKFLLEKLSCFSFAKNTLFFTLIVQWVFSFSRTAFSFHFSPWFFFRYCYIFISRCIWTSSLCWFSSKELFQKGLNGVGKDKKISCKKVVQKGACLDCGLDFFMMCLMLFW